ncbi:bifunctional ribokinase/ribose-5-phosphate isomerase A-like [Dysidea avara]|uniref:bifunctional ribokinase/ribose-5-phosphate isomerase A-like n=1 Tax=Dysidea avara TaxID=196820 RepID=UPI00331A730A
MISRTSGVVRLCTRCGGRYFSTIRGGGTVLGCGSNVVDNIYKVRALPRPGDKGFFDCQNKKILQQKVVGGVTLNHLAWAAQVGVDTGLLAIHGNDEAGTFIRSNLRRLGVSLKYITVENTEMSGQCHVLIENSGERSIIMAPGATSRIDNDYVNKHFCSHIKTDASMLTTEISQVPLSGVIALLKCAREAGILTVLDLDTTPEVALHQALLGTEQELIECVKLADVLKPAKAAADDMLSMLTGTRSTSAADLAHQLQQQCGSTLVAITHGSELSILANEHHVVEVPALIVDKVVDTTGAGDAFLGGIVAGLSNRGLPTDKEQLRWLGQVANSFGAACVQTIGGTPTEQSRNTLMTYLKDLGLGVSITEEEKCQSFQESLKNDMAATRHAGQLDMVEVDNFISRLMNCEGQLFVSGVGKSGVVAQRLAASLSSVGVAASFVHGAEWGHGDLGRVHPGRDTVVFLSHSGQTEECVSSARHLREKGISCLCIISRPDSTLAKLCDGHIHYDNLEVKEKFDVIPTGSIVIQELISNAILYEVIERRGITKRIFKINHPSGAIGMTLEDY